MERAELASWLRLALTPGVGNQAARKLLAAFGLPENIFRQPVSALRDVVPGGAAESLRSAPAGFDKQLDATLHWLQATESPGRRRILTLADASYPASLLRIDDPPLLLYLLGQPHEDLARAIAVVGSRNPTGQGLENARRFGRAFAEAGLTVVSGMALGVDGAAHEGALEGAPEGQLATIAVVGTGLDRVYPRQHLALAHRIAERGLIVSEYPIGTPPLQQNFPKRNRLIAAVADGTLVVEAALKSGSLITARLAAEQGKEVFAVPGSIHSPQARGCHALLRDGAKLVESAQDVLEELHAGVRPRRVPDGIGEGEGEGEGDEGEFEGEAGTGAARAEDPLLAAMGFDPVGIDALVARTGIAASALQARLLQLELEGHVGRLPGGLFQRMARA